MRQREEDEQGGAEQLTALAESVEDSERFN